MPGPQTSCLRRGQYRVESLTVMNAFAFPSPRNVRCDWTRAEVEKIFNQPLLDLVHAAQTTHREYFGSPEVQLCQLLSIKTGGCPEDCAYCPQSAHYPTAVDRQDLMSVEEV